MPCINLSEHWTNLERLTDTHITSRFSPITVRVYIKKSSIPIKKDGGLSQFYRKICFSTDMEEDMLFE